MFDGLFGIKYKIIFKIIFAVIGQGDQLFHCIEVKPVSRGVVARLALSLWSVKVVTVMPL